jgi:ubiquinone/menaquinone biosynthesis C-methylase UbiE
MTSLPEFYRDNVTWVGSLDRRLSAVARLAAARKPNRLLDVGCGEGVLLNALSSMLPDAQLVGIDAVPAPPAVRWCGVTGDIARRLPFSGEAFDVVVAGEVLEHVPNPDLMLAEFRRVLSPRGLVVLSTPNIVSWANRVLVPLGIQPLFTETSSEVHLGRRWRLLGQGNQVQGHLKVFSHRALREILHRTGFSIVQMVGMPGEFPAPVDRVDRFCARFPPIASDLLVVAVKADEVPPSAPPRRKDGRPAYEDARWARPRENNG